MAEPERPFGTGRPVRISPYGLTLRVDQVERAPTDVVIEINLPSCQSQRVRADETSLTRCVEPRPHELQAVAFLHDPELSNELERIGNRFCRPEQFAKREIVVVIDVRSRRAGHPNG